MATARQIITGALTHHLNRLSPGETLDSDLASMCLAALNEIADEWNGAGFFLWADALHSAVVTGPTATLGVTFPGLESGENIYGATYDSGWGDVPIEAITFAQWHEAVIEKNVTGGYPQYWAHDGAATLYFYPAASGQTIKLRTKVSMSEFANLETDYVMPSGYRAALAAVLAERVAPTVVGQIPPSVRAAAARSLRAIKSQQAEPGILTSPAAPAIGSNTLMMGWR
jgi:hypothetical protein